MFSLLPSRRCAGLATTLATLSLTTFSYAGNVLNVPGNFPDISSAIQAASDGDLVLVQPGIYSPFSINNLSLSVVAAPGTTFSIAATPGVPEISVSNIDLEHSVSIIGARIDFDDPLAPAISVIDNLGSVRLSDVVVDRIGNIFNATIQAVIEVKSTETFWLIDSSVWSLSGTGWVGQTTNTRFAGGLDNDGISALQMDESHGVVQNTRLWGYFNTGGVTLDGFGGDALRTIGDSNVWLLQDNQAPAYPCLLRGGGGVYGGNSIHQFRTPALPGLIRSCGGFDSPTTIPISISYAPGQNAVVGLGRLGGPFGFNNTNGSVSQGSIIVFRQAKHCDADELNETSMPDTVSIGTNLTVRVRTRLDRDHFLLLSNTTLYTPSITPFTGRGMLNGAVVLTSQAGTTTGQVPSDLNLFVPNVPALVGSQITVQAAFGPTGGPLDNLGLPSMSVVVP